MSNDTMLSNRVALVSRCRPWLALLAGLGLLVAGCEVEQTEEGNLPDVEVEGGNLPKYDVEAADVDVKTKKMEVEVPDVDVTMPDEKKEGEQ